MDASPSSSTIHPGWQKLLRPTTDVRRQPVRPSQLPEDRVEADVLTDEADQSQSLSDSVSEAAERVWWARALMHHTQSMDLMGDEGSSNARCLPLKLLSSCTGSGAEAACLKDCFETCWMCWVCCSSCVVAAVQVAKLKLLVAALFPISRVI